VFSLHRFILRVKDWFRPFYPHEFPLFVKSFSLWVSFPAQERSVLFFLAGNTPPFPLFRFPPLALSEKFPTHLISDWEFSTLLVTPWYLMSTSFSPPLPGFFSIQSLHFLRISRSSLRLFPCFCRRVGCFCSIGSPPFFPN